MSEITSQPELLPACRRTYEDLLTDLLVALVSYPTDIEVFQLDNGKCLHFEVTAHKDDHGQIIGKKGATIGSIRTLLVAIARGTNVKIDIKEP